MGSYSERERERESESESESECESESERRREREREGERERERLRNPEMPSEISSSGRGKECDRPLQSGTREEGIRGGGE